MIDGNLITPSQSFFSFNLNCQNERRNGVWFWSTDWGMGDTNLIQSQEIVRQNKTLSLLKGEIAVAYAGLLIFGNNLI